MMKKQTRRKHTIAFKPGDYMGNEGSKSKISTYSIQALVGNEGSKLKISTYTIIKVTNTLTVSSASGKRFNGWYPWSEFEI